MRQNHGKCMQMASPKLVNSKKDDFNKFVKKGYISQLLKDHSLGDDGAMARKYVICGVAPKIFSHFHPFSSIFIHFISFHPLYSLSSYFIHFIHFYWLSSIASTFVHFHPLHLIRKLSFLFSTFIQFNQSSVMFQS